jgi:hypothetical protein
METIIFDENKNQHVIYYQEKPVINIIRANFVSSNRDWVNQLFNTYFFIKISVLDNEKKEIASEQNPLSFGTFITPYHRQPVLEINKTFPFSINSTFNDFTSYKNWKIDIILNNLKFNEGDSLLVEYMDTLHIKMRVDDWEIRVHNLIENLKEWTKDNDFIKINPSRKLKMHEGLMKTFNVSMREIESADILKNDKIIFALKPFGLWIIGANGRIDLLSAKGNYILIDEAESFQQPKWKLFLKNNKKQGKDFTKDVFNQLLEL